LGNKTKQYTPGRRQVLGRATAVQDERRSIAPSWITRTDTVFDRLASRVSNPDWIVFDGWAVRFYMVAVCLFALLSLSGLNGSSISIYSSLYHYGAPGVSPLAGEPRPIRSDEWSFHTPLILNQCLRYDRFSLVGGDVGPGNALLIANVPVKHFSTVFRPQFWAFFVLPLTQAFAAYWQAKWLILVTGTFTLLLLLTRSTLLSAIGAVWYLFSSATQWQFSWPSLLPEMTGLSCWIVCLTCYALVGTNTARIAIASLCAVGCVVNFTLCAYLPHQIPLVWFAVVVTGVWAATHLGIIWRQGFRLRRSVVLAGAACFAIVLLALIYRDIADVIRIVAHTTYPGQRRMSGGGFTIAGLGSHLFDLWKSETHIPQAMGNISEGTGFLWLAPVSLFCFARRKPLTSDQKVLFCGVGIVFIMLWSYLLLPIPVSIAQYTFLDRVGAGRCWPALGLANIAIVTMAMAWPHRSGGRHLQGHIIEVGGIFAVVLVILGLVNASFGNFLTIPGLWLCAAFVTAVLKCILEAWAGAFAAVVLIPSIAVLALANPVSAGLDSILRSELFRTVHSNPDLLKGKWVVFSQSGVPSGFFSSVGATVYTGLKYAPDLESLATFNSEPASRKLVNQSGFILALPGFPGAPPHFESLALGIVGLRISPLSPMLRRAGIGYMAFDSRPSAGIEAHLRPAAHNPVSTFWLYETVAENAESGSPIIFGSPSETTAARQTFTFTAGKLLNPVYRLYFLVNSGPSIPHNTCHGFYDRPSNALYLYSDSLSEAYGPLKLGSAESIQNSQCIVNGVGSSTVSTSGTDVAIKVDLGLRGRYAVEQNVYMWVKDSKGQDTGWIKTGKWREHQGLP
jgi:hypothetical protein